MIGLGLAERQEIREWLDFNYTVRREFQCSTAVLFVTLTILEMYNTEIQSLDSINTLDSTEKHRQCDSLAA